MEYMLLILHPRGQAARENVTMPEMGKYAGELTAAGKMRGGAPLMPEAQGARLRLSGARREVTDGPFAESKEVIGGYFLVDAKDAAEALELAKRCPHARAGTVGLHQAMREVGDPPPAPGTRFLLVFLEDGKLTDPDGSKYDQMMKWTESLKRDKVYVECAGLAKDPPGRRVEIHAGKAVVTDGPFAETKEIVGGYALVAVPDRRAALELAARCPHAAWGAIEVREVMNVPAI
ncbi:MAG TPA: YciI family protein [Myxococcota bacterium]|nr:YciI family protein [Myxococcota bacterium]